MAWIVGFFERLIDLLVDDVLGQLRSVLEDEADDRGEGKVEGEDRQEPVVRDQRRVASEPAHPVVVEAEPVEVRAVSRGEAVAAAPVGQDGAFRLALPTGVDVVLENTGVIRSMTRSWDLVRGAWWRTFGSYLQKIQPDFDSRLHGFKKLSDLVRGRTDLFATEERSAPGSTAKQLYIKAKPQGATETST